MSSYAQEWVWRYSKAQGIVKYVFLAIARRICRKDGIETPPTSIEQIVEKTGLGEKTVRRSLQKLNQTYDEIEILKGKHGSPHRFRLRRQLKLPVDAEGPSDWSVGPLPPVSETGGRSGQSDQRERSERPARLASPVRVTGASVQQASDSDRTDLSTQDLRTTTTSREEAVATEALFAWIRCEYPSHNGGAHFTLEKTAALAVLVELLSHRSAERLQAMLVALWTVTLEEDVWCFESDRSLFALRHAADRLDRIVVARARAREAVVSQPGETVWDVVVRQLKGRIHRDGFQTWFRPLRLVEDRGDVLLIEAPNEQVVQWIQQHYHDVLQEAVEEVRAGAGVTFCVARADRRTA